MPKSQGAGAPEVVLSGGGVTARFDGRRLLLVQGATTWTVPVRAVRSAELLSGGEVRIELSGDAEGAQHGLGAGVSIPCRNAHAAKAFTNRLQRALRASDTVADGHALVLVETRQHGTSPLTHKGIKIGTAVLAYAAVLVIIGRYGAGEAGAELGVFGVLGAAGLALLYFCWVRLIRDILVLRRRGITVSGHSEGTVAGFGGNVFYFRVLSYRTLEGMSFKEVKSRGSVSGRTSGIGPVDVTYDPLKPSTATGPLSFNHVWWTLFLVVTGLVFVLLWAGVLYVAALG
jgi:hypothetical protein